jgi:hypothetical protein
MSPVVQRQRMPSTRSAGPDQHWGMLLFESLSAGAMAVLFGLAMVMLAVGLYALLVWPVTFWDLADTGLEKYEGWTKIVLWSVFAGGTLAGYWCFSGAAFKRKSKVTRSAPARSGKFGRS